MNEYSPFLKFKNGELNALFNLLPEDRDIIVPLLELPRDNKYTEISLINRINSNLKKMKNNLISDFIFFLDNLEVPDAIKINGKDNYLYLLNEFSIFNIIPVIGFDRAETHNTIGINYANKKTKRIAFRITQDYFDNIFAYKRDLEDLCKKINSDVSHILILDCSYIDDNKIIEKCKIGINRILEYIINLNIFSKIVITGSSIPASINDKVKTGTFVELNRNEVTIFKEIKKYDLKVNFVFGDYTVVSSEYSEVNMDPRAMFSIITPKVVYSTLDSQYVNRGKKIKEHGFGQYFTQVEAIIKKPFFRKDNSWGDKYLYEKVKNKTTNITPSSIIGPTVNSHMKFMIDEIKKGSI